MNGEAPRDVIAYQLLAAEADLEVDVQRGGLGLTLTVDNADGVPLGVEVDSALLKGPDEVSQLEGQVADDLMEYCRLAADLGFHAELRTSIGTDVVLELRRLCFEVSREFTHSVFFAGQLVSLRRSGQRRRR